MITMPKLHITFLICLLLTGLVAGCGYLRTEEPPEIVAFIINPAEIKAGETATLLWNVNGALTVIIDPGIGTVTVAGVKEVSPVATTTYTLTATNFVASVTESVTLTVHETEQISPDEEAVPPAPEPTAEEYYNLGVYLTEKERYEHAIMQFDRALELEPDYSDAYHGRGRAYYDKGDYWSAIADYTRAIELNSGLVRAYLDRGIAYRRCGNEAQALADFKRCIELSSDPSLAEKTRKEIQKLESQ